MRALGIDPGSRVTGWGVVELDGTALRAVEWGTIRLGSGRSVAIRLGRLHDACRELLGVWTPAVLVLERAFVARNVQSALRLGEARGVILAAAANAESDAESDAESTNSPYVAAELNATAASRTRAASSQAALAAADDAAAISPRSSGSTRTTRRSTSPA